MILDSRGKVGAGQLPAWLPAVIEFFMLVGPGDALNG
jgi:hypothetical protein